MELDDDKDALAQTFSALTLAVDDYSSASGDQEKAQIATKLTELLVEIQRMVAKCNQTFIAKAFTPSTCKSWCLQLSRMPSTSEQFDLTRDILKVCFNALPPRTMFAQYSSILASHLIDSQRSPESKEFILKDVITKAFERADVDSIRQFSSSSDGQNVAVSLIGCLSDRAISVSEAASKCLVGLCRRNPAGAPALLSAERVLNSLRSMLTAKDVVRFRLYEFTGVISIIDSQCLQFCAANGFTGALLKEIDSDDILCQLNAMEILAEMAAPATGTDHCLRYFQGQGLLNKLNNMLLKSRESPDATFLFPAVIKFFGHLSRLYPKECCEDFPLFLSSVFDLVLNYNRLEVGQRLLAFDTLGLIGSTPAGKAVLAKYDEPMKKCMFCFGNSFKQGPVEVRVRHMEALGSLLELKQADQTDDLLNVTLRWFTWLERGGKENDSCKLLFDLFRQPFPEIHLAAGQLFKKLVVQEWSRTLMSQQAGFLEYLLNRKTEHTLEGRYVKYEIAKCLAEAPNIADSFEEADVLRLKQFVQEGPHHVKAQAPDVAFEEA